MAKKKSDKIGEAYLEVKADLTKVNSELMKFRRQTDEKFEKMSKSTTKKATSMGNRISGVFGKMALAAGAAFAAIEAGKKVFQWAKEGAQLKQLRKSFDLLNNSVIKVPGLLDKMRKATRGTASDAVLMKGILTLSAGASDEFTEAIGKNAAKLLEIAKAANKLNPLLGDTGFMFDSLALGIKRSSPMILDNLGLTIKVGDANQKYADALGKTVEEMTKAEQQQALLNATLKAGDKLINQVGGSITAQGDVFDQYATILGNAWDTIKVGIGGFFGSMLGQDRIDAATAALKKSYQAIKDQEQAYKELSGKTKEQRMELDKLLEAEIKKKNAQKSMLTDDSQKAIQDEIDALQRRRNAIETYESWKKTHDEKEKKRLEKEKKRAAEKARLAAIEANTMKGLKDRIKELTAEIDKKQSTDLEGIKILRDEIRLLQIRLQIAKEYGEEIKAGKAKGLEQQDTMTTGAGAMSGGMSGQVDPGEKAKRDLEEVTQLTLIYQNVQNSLARSIEIAAKTSASTWARQITLFKQANSIAQQFLNNLVQIAAQQLAIQAIGSFSDGGSGILGGIASLFAAKGGNFANAQKMSSGGNAVVPNGFQSDNFPVMVKSDESLEVKNRHQQVASDRILSKIESSIAALNMNMTEMGSPNIYINNNMDADSLNEVKLVPSKNKLTDQGVQFDNV